MLPFEDYLMRFSGPVQERLIQILLLLQEAFPTAEQRMYHGLPSFFFGKRDIINVGAYKDHISVYLTFNLIAELKKDYPACSYTKGTIRFSHAEPPPFDILRDICARIQAALENGTYM